MTVSANESRKIMERIGFPQEAVDTIGDCTERVSENADFNALVDEFIAHPENLDSVLERLKALSEQLGENEYTMNMCLLLGACPALRERYAEKGIDEAIFWKSIEADSSSRKQTLTPITMRSAATSSSAATRS